MISKWKLPEWRWDGLTDRLIGWVDRLSTLLTRCIHGSVFLVDFILSFLFVPVLLTFFIYFLIIDLILIGFCSPFNYRISFEFNSDIFFLCVYCFMWSSVIFVFVFALLFHNIASGLCMIFLTYCFQMLLYSDAPRPAQLNRQRTVLVVGLLFV